MLENLGRREAVILGVMVLIMVVRWGTYTSDFGRVTDLGLGTEENRWLSPPLIGEVGALFRDALTRNDPFGVAETVERMYDGASCLLLLDRMLEINWDETYVTVPIVSMMTGAGRYLYYGP